MSWRERIAVAIVIAAIAVGAHLPALHGEFLLDDVGEIAENPSIRLLWPPGIPMFTGGSLPHRPLPYLSFALNYAIGGLDTAGYHAFNLCVHLANGLLVWWILERLVSVHEAARREYEGRELRYWLPPAAAGLWLLHPMVMQAVDYVYQRMESLAALAMLGAVACFLEGMKPAASRRWLTASVAASGFGMLCKETAVATPAIIAVIDLWLQRHLVRKDPKQSPSLPARRAYYAALLATPLLAVAVVLVQRQRFSELSAPSTGALEYLVNQPLVVFDYLRKAAWPHDLCLDHYRLPCRQPALLAAGLALASAILVGAALMSRRRPTLGLGVAVFAILLAPTSSVLPVTDLEVEHRMYLPLAVVVAGCLAAGIEAVECLGLTRRQQRICWISAVLIVGAGLATATWLRADVYATRRAMWEDVVCKAPQNPRAWAILGDERCKQGELQAALEAFDRSLALEPRAALPHARKSDILLALGRASEALAESDLAISINPARGRGFVGRAIALIELDRLAEAEAAARRAVEVDPLDLQAIGVLAQTLALTGKNGEAIQLCRRLFAADPPVEGQAGGAEVRHGQRLATLAAALAAGADVQPQQIEALLERASVFDPRGSRTLKMTLEARQRLAKRPGEALP